MYFLHAPRGAVRRQIAEYIAHERADVRTFEQSWIAFDRHALRPRAHDLEAERDEFLGMIFGHGGFTRADRERQRHEQ